VITGAAFGRRAVGDLPSPHAPSQGSNLAAAERPAWDIPPENSTPSVRPGEADGRLNSIKVSVFNALLDAVDLNEISKLAPDAVREELTDIISEIINIKKFVLSAAEQQALVGDICNDILGLGPLEPLLARDDIADIMVNGADRVYIETGGRIVL